MSKIQALVSVTITAEADVEIEEEGVKARLPREPWKTCDLTLRIPEGEKPISMTHEAVQTTRDTLLWAVINRLAQTVKLPEGIETPGLPVKGEIN